MNAVELYELCTVNRHGWVLFASSFQNSIHRLLKSFIKFVQKGLLYFGKNGSEKHITRQKNTVVINVFIAKKLDFQN